VFDSGGGTSSYQEIDDADLIVLWDPTPARRIRSSSSTCSGRAQGPSLRGRPAADQHGQVGAQVAALNVARTSAGQRHRPRDHPLRTANKSFIERGTEGFEEFAASVQSGPRLRNLQDR